MLRKIGANQGIGKQVWSVPKRVDGSEESQNPTKFSIFPLYLRVEIVIFYQYEHFFFLKTGNLITIKGYSDTLTKCKIKVTSKIPIF